MCQRDALEDLFLEGESCDQVRFSGRPAFFEHEQVDASAADGCEGGEGSAGLLSGEHLFGEGREVDGEGGIGFAERRGRREAGVEAAVIDPGPGGGDGAGVGRRAGAGVRAEAPEGDEGGDGEVEGAGGAVGDVAGEEDGAG